MNFARFNKIWSRGFENKAKKPNFDIEHPITPLRALSKKVAFFQKNQLGMGLSWRKLVQMGQKLILEPLYSKI